MVGVPGSGKSFFATQFGETFNAPVIGYDRLRYELFSEPTFSNEEQQIIGRIASLELGELLKTRSTIIVDGAHNTKVSRHNLGQLARSAGYETLTVWVQTDEATARSRSLKRSKRRQGDAYNVSLTPEQFAAETKRFTAPADPERYIVISGKHTYAAQARTVLKRFAEESRDAGTAARPTPTEPIAGETLPKIKRGGRNIIIR